jgi:uncharacterized protein YaiE (UPF0345 family)
MSQFENVTVIKKANVYFDGKITSRTIQFANGDKKTLGILMPGAYEFGTEAAEVMEILSGTVGVVLAGEDKQSTYKAGESFYVPAHSSFKIKTKEIADYCCSYV